MANPDAITGNIGARMTFEDMSGLFAKIGYNETSIESGDMKDMGTPARPLTPGEQAVIQSIVNESYQEFRSAVLQSRGSRLDMAAFEQAEDGRILSGRQAFKIGLVDQLGSEKDAIAKAAQLGGINSTDPSLCELTSDTPGKGLLGSLVSEVEQSSLQKANGPKLSYQ
jgi:protease-4